MALKLLEGYIPEEEKKKLRLLSDYEPTMPIRPPIEEPTQPFTPTEPSPFARVKELFQRPEIMQAIKAPLELRLGVGPSVELVGRKALEYWHRASTATLSALEAQAVSTTKPWAKKPILPALRSGWRLEVPEEELSESLVTAMGLSPTEAIGFKPTAQRVGREFLKAWYQTYGTDPVIFALNVKALPAARKIALFNKAVNIAGKKGAEVLATVRPDISPKIAERFFKTLARNTMGRQMAIAKVNLKGVKTSELKRLIRTLKTIKPIPPAPKIAPPIPPTKAIVPVRPPVTPPAPPVTPPITPVARPPVTPPAVPPVAPEVIRNAKQEINRLTLRENLSKENIVKAEKLLTQIPRGKAYQYGDFARVIRDAKKDLLIKPTPPPIPKELEPLAVEARKYKSAEEFYSKIKDTLTRENFKNLSRGGFGSIWGVREQRMPSEVLKSFYQQAIKGMPTPKEPFKPAVAKPGEAVRVFEAGLPEEQKLLEFKKMLKGEGFVTYPASPALKRFIRGLPENVVKREAIAEYERVFKVFAKKPSPAVFKKRIRSVTGLEPSPFVPVRKDILLKERVRAEARGARFGELEGRRQKQVVINDIRAKQRGIQEIKTDAITYLNQNLGLKDRGKFLVAVRDVKKSEELVTIINRAEAVSAQTGRRFAIDALKRESKRTRKILAIGRRKKGKPRISVEAQDRLRGIIDNLTQFKPGGEKQRAIEMASTFYATHPDQAMPPELKKKVYDLSRANISEMSTEEIKQLTKDIRSIRESGRTALEVKEEARLQILERNKSGLITSINRHSIKKPEVVEPGKVLTPAERRKSKFVRLKESLNRATFELKIPSFITDALDGYKMFPVLGKAHQLISAPINKASDLEESGISQINKKVAQILSPLGKKASWYLGQEETILGREFTKENMWAIYANSKNASNRATLTEDWGYNFSEELVNEIVSKVNPRDKRMVDRIMKEVVEDIYPETVRVTQEYSGFTPKTVKDYWMIMGDKELSDRVLMREKEKDLLADVWKKTSMDLGSVKERVGRSGAPDLSFFRVLKRHTTETIHFNTHALAVRNVQEVINDPTVKEAMINSIGKGGYNALKSSLSDVANPKKTPASWLESRAKGLRRNSTAVMLGIKVSVSLLQGGSIFQTIYRTGLPNTLWGIKTYWKNPRVADRFIYEHSPAQKYRRRSFDRELKELIDGMDWLGKLPGARNLVFSMIQGVDHITTMPSWLSAYHQAEKRRLSLENIIAHADDIVEKTQPTGRIKALAKIMRGSEFQHWFTMFYTFFSNAYNNMSHAGGKFRYRVAKGEIKERVLSFAEFSRAYFWLLIMTGLYAAMVRKPRKFFTRDWGREKMTYLAKSIGSYALGTIPFVRDIGNVIINPQFDFTGSPVFGVGKEAKILAQKRAKTIEGIQKQKERKLKAGTMIGG
ncbi:hypothetical protein LCGC14_0399420, partial [marine sediment metagenome]